MGNGGGDDDEGQGEAEDNVGEAVDAWREVAAQAEALVSLGLVGELHGCGQCSALAGWLGRGTLDRPDRACGEAEDSADELEDAADHDAQQAEGQEEEPDNREEDKREQGCGPADDEEDQEEEKLHGWWLPFFRVYAGDVAEVPWLV